LRAPASRNLMGVIALQTSTADHVSKPLDDLCLLA
jgi:hypothetical protein